MTLNKDSQIDYAKAQAAQPASSDDKEGSLRAAFFIAWPFWKSGFSSSSSPDHNDG